MKKVWILEGLYTKDEMLSTIKEYTELRDSGQFTDSEHIDALNKAISRITEALNENPNGKWLGYQGKIIWKQFCECALETMTYLKHKKFRVVEALIPDDATNWNGYTVVRENEGALRYLMYKKNYC